MSVNNFLSQQRNIDRDGQFAMFDASCNSGTDGYRQLMDINRLILRFDIGVLLEYMGHSGNDSMNNNELNNCDTMFGKMVQTLHGNYLLFNLSILTGLIVLFLYNGVVSSSNIFISGKATKYTDKLEIYSVVMISKDLFLIYNMCKKLFSYSPEYLFHDESASITHIVYNLFKTIVNSIINLNSSYFIATQYQPQKTFESKGKKVDYTMIVSKRTICFIHAISNESNSKENILCSSFILNKTSNLNDNQLNIVETIESYYDLSFTNNTTIQYSRSLIYGLIEANMGLKICSILGDLNKSNTMIKLYNSTITQRFNTKSYVYHDKLIIAGKNYDMNFNFIRSMTSLIFDNMISMQ